jgi:hypothetical protein
MESTPGEATTPEAAPAPSPRPTPTREYRAMATFVVVTAVIILILFVVGSQAGALVGFTGGLLLGPVLAAVANGVEAYGLSQRHDWARFAMLPMLWIVLVAGLISSLLALGQGRIEIPVGSLLAAWALTARPSAALGPVPGSSTQGALLVAAAFFAALVPFLGSF